MTLSPARPAAQSLYQLALQSQEVDGQLAIAFDLVTSDDPEQQQEAERLISSLLEQANTSQALLHQKANAICHVHESLLARAEHLSQIAADRAAKAAADKRAAERLKDYLSRCLTALHPGQRKFELPEFTVASRASEAIEADPELVPPSLQRSEIRIKITSGHAEAVDQLLSVVTETLRDLYALPGDAYEVSYSSSPDKAAIKAAIKAGEPVIGARLDKRTSWSIK